MEPSEVITLRESKSKMAWLLAVFLIFFGFGWVLALDPSPRGAISDELLGWILVVVCGAVIASVLVRIVRAGSRLLISRDGIEDLRNGLGVIPWPEIAFVEPRPMFGTLFLSLSLRNPEQWVSRLPASQRWGSGINRALGFHDVNIIISGLDRRPETIMGLVEEHLSCQESSKP